MSTETITMTVKEALESGYIFACDETCEYFKSISKLTKEDFECHSLFLASKETFNYSISAGSIQEAIETIIEDQDDVNDEDDTLYSQLGSVDWKAVAALINSCFTSDYHSPTDIKLIP